MTPDDFSIPPHDDVRRLPAAQSLEQALMTLHIARRLLARRGTALAGQHVQLAIDLIAPLARDQRGPSLASGQRSNWRSTALLQSRRHHSDCFQIRAAHHGHQEAPVSAFPALRASNSTFAATPECEASAQVLTA